MKALLVRSFRDAVYGRSQTDHDVSAVTRRHIYINVRSIWWPPEIDQRQPKSNTNIEEKVSALFVPEETRNYIGKTFFETWCRNHGCFKPEIDIVWIEFTFDGQTQPFETMHHIINNGESVQFYSNRSPDLVKHIREYCTNLPKGHGSAHPKEAVAVRSRTWPLRRWPRFLGIQHARKKKHDKPVIRLGEVKDPVYTRQPQINSGDVAVNRVEDRESLVQHASEDNLRGGPLALITTPPATIPPPAFILSLHAIPSPLATPSSITSPSQVTTPSPVAIPSSITTPSPLAIPLPVTLPSPVSIPPSCSRPQDNCARLRCAASSDDHWENHDSGTHILLKSDSRPTNKVEPSPELLLSLEGPDLEIRLNENVRDTSGFQLNQNVLAGSDPPSLATRPETVNSATEQRKNDNSVTAIPGHVVPVMVVNTLLDSGTQIPSVPDEVLEFKESQSKSQSKVASQQLHESTKAHPSLPDTDGSEPGLTMGRTNSSESWTDLGGFVYPSITKRIFQDDGGLDRGIYSEEKFGIGNMGGNNNGSIAQEASSSSRPGHQEPEYSANKPDELEKTSVRKDKIPNIAKPLWPAGYPNEASSPVRGAGKLKNPEVQDTNAAVASSSKAVAKFHNYEQKPGGYDEVDAWDYCDEFDNASMVSSDSEGLPFPDDYWAYDYEAKNYYHEEVGDDGKKTISWYPLEFD